MADDVLFRWPARMPTPLTDGYGLNPEDRRARSEFDIGAQFRVEFDTDESVADCSLFVDADQARWLESFERNFLNQGGLWFLMPLWAGGRLLEHRVRFKTRPELAAKFGQYSQYNFQLDVARREGLMDADWAEYLLEADPDGLINFFDRLQQIVNVKLPADLPFTEK